MAVKAYPNVRKTNKFKVFLEGINVALVDEVKLPDEEILTDKHASPGDVADMPTPSGRQYSEMILKQVYPADAPLTFWGDWMNDLIGDDTGEFGDVDANSRVITVVELGLEDMPLDQHSYLVFPTKKITPEFKGGSEGKNLIKEITLTVIRKVM